MGLNRKIKIWFTDFWRNFDEQDNWFIQFLLDHFDIELDRKQPDFLIYSCFGNQFRKFNCRRIFYTGENVRPNYYECDYALGFDLEPVRARYFRLPLYGIDPERDPVKLLRPRPSFASWLQEGRDFCSFVVSADNCQFRKDFFLELNNRIPIASGGRLLNNTGGPVADKFEFIRKYYLNISFENEAYPGYTTEKIIQPMFTNTIPVYWGNPFIHLDFNTASFIQVKDVQSVKDTIHFLEAAYKNHELLKPIYEQPWFSNNSLNPYVDKVQIRAFFEKIFFSPEKKPIAQNYYSLGMSQLQRIITKIQNRY